MQAVIRKAKKCKLFVKNNATENPGGHLIIRCICQIPLLQEHKIDEGVQVVKKIVKKTYEDDNETEKRWMNFITGYFVKQWGKTVKKKVFCVFNEVDRSINFSETNNHLTAEMMKVRPTCFDYIRKIFMFNFQF